LVLRVTAETHMYSESTRSTSPILKMDAVVTTNCVTVESEDRVSTAVFDLGVYTSSQFCYSPFGGAGRFRQPPQLSSGARTISCHHRARMPSDGPRV